MELMSSNMVNVSTEASVDRALLSELLRRVVFLEREVELLRDSKHGPKEVFSRDEAAAFLTIGTTALDDLIGSGQLKARRVGSRVLILRRDLFSILEGDD